MFDVFKKRDGGALGPAVLIPSGSMPLTLVNALLTQRYGSCSVVEPIRLGDRAASRTQLGATQVVVACFPDFAALLGIGAAVADLRIATGSNIPALIVVLRPQHLLACGSWLEELADMGLLSGVRLAVARDEAEAVRAVEELLGPVDGLSVIRMPISPEIENSPKKNFYTISPQSRRVTQLMVDLADNGMTRVYLLGAPGAGKTSLAYAYFLARGRGNFVTVNLNVESSADKGSMRSLLCGQVQGSTPGAAAREGALSFAKGGVCFLDESHGASGVVMQVLMEVLENGQYLPFGGTAKRQLDCALLFASNRSWEALRAQMHIDEHARLGATIIEIADLRSRMEDLIAVLASSLGGLRKKWKSWGVPAGLTDEAWELVRSCRWRGNVRALMRVIEAAAVRMARRGERGGGLLGADDVRHGLQLWEPDETTDLVQYATFE
jgi:hypothetical protein